MISKAKALSKTTLSSMPACSFAPGVHGVKSHFAPRGPWSVFFVLFWTNYKANCSPHSERVLHDLTSQHWQPILSVLQPISSGFFLPPSLFGKSFLFCVFCLHACLCDSARSLQSWNYRWLWAAMWVLGFEPRCSERAAGVLNHWAISPSCFSLSFHQLTYCQSPLPSCNHSILYA